VVSNAQGNAVSNDGTLTVTGNSAPVATITQPAAGAQYSGGDVIAYAGSGSDAEDGTLPASALTWQVDFHHDTHVHPFLPPWSGVTSGTFTIPRTGETSANVWYRIYLTVTDAQGMRTTTFRDILPRTVTITLATQSGLQLTLDGQPFTGPSTFTAVVGMVRTIGAPSPQVRGKFTYTFRSWSDGGGPKPRHHDTSRQHHVLSQFQQEQELEPFSLVCGAEGWNSSRFSRNPCRCDHAEVRTALAVTRLPSLGRCRRAKASSFPTQNPEPRIPNPESL
jgi:hypothetical protein